jgi:CRP-like cAMP-binding protein
MPFSVQRVPSASPPVRFHEGDPADGLILLQDGQVRIWRCSPEGAMTTVHVLGAGDLPGCVAAFCQSAYPASATALSPVRALWWPASAIPALIRSFPALAINVLRVIGTRNEELLQRLQEVATENVERRVLRAILRLVRSARGAAADGPVELPVRRQDIAEMAATTLHSVSRLVSRWERAGLLIAGRGRIVLRDVPALAAELDR